MKISTEQLQDKTSKLEDEVLMKIVVEIWCKFPRT